MHTSPTTALIALLASTAGSLTAWYAPTPLLPALLFAILAYTATVLGLAAAFRIPRDEALATTSLLIIRAATITIQTAAGATLHLLTAAEHWLTRHQPAKTPSYIHAA